MQHARRPRMMATLPIFISRMEGRREDRSADQFVREYEDPPDGDIRREPPAYSIMAADRRRAAAFPVLMPAPRRGSRWRRPPPATTTPLPPRCGPATRYLPVIGITVRNRNEDSRPSSRRQRRSSELLSGKWKETDKCAVESHQINARDVSSSHADKVEK